MVFLCAERGTLYMAMGIYEIYNIKTGKRYIGSSKNIESRWQSHISGLKRGDHHNYYLQKDYHRYGEDSFVFTVIKIVDSEDLLFEYEDIYIKKFKFSKLYNSLRKPGDIPKCKSRWMSYCEQDKRKKEDTKDDWGWGE